MRKLNLFLWFMFFSILYYHLIWCSSTIIVEPCKITVWRLQSAKVPNYACPVVCLYRCCNEIENLYTDFESCISVIADSRNYDYEINGYIWIVTLLLWVFFSSWFSIYVIVGEEPYMYEHWCLLLNRTGGRSLSPICAACLVQWLPWYNLQVENLLNLVILLNFKIQKKTEKCLLYIIKKYLT